MSPDEKAPPHCKLSLIKALIQESKVRMMMSATELVLETGESIRTSTLMLEFNKQLNAAIVDPNFIASVRKRLHLDQRQAGEIFGGGVNAFLVTKKEKPNYR